MKLLVTGTSKHMMNVRGIIWFHNQPFHDDDEHSCKQSLFRDRCFHVRDDQSCVTSTRMAFVHLHSFRFRSKTTSASSMLKCAFWLIEIPRREIYCSRILSSESVDLTDVYMDLACSLTDSSALSRVRGIAEPVSQGKLFASKQQQCWRQNTHAGESLEKTTKT